MIDINTVLEYLQTALPDYVIDLSRDRELNLQSIATLPAIYIGYGRCYSLYPKNGFEGDFMDLHGEDVIQAFSVHIVDVPENIYLTWRNMYKAFRSFSPTINLSSFPGITGFSYGEGAPAGLSNGKIWWQDIWNIHLPTMNPEF